MIYDSLLIASHLHGQDHGNQEISQVMVTLVILCRWNIQSLLSKISTKVELNIREMSTDQHIHESICTAPIPYCKCLDHYNHSCSSCHPFSGKQEEYIKMHCIKHGGCALSPTKCQFVTINKINPKLAQI